MAFEGLTEKLSAVFKSLRNRGKLSEGDVKAVMREVRLALLEADVNYKVAKDFIARVTESCVGEAVLKSLTPAQQVIKIVGDEMTALMGGEPARLYIPSKPPGVILMCGLQGSGKTTHAAKLAAHLREQGHRPLLIACDVYRPAAIRQLQIVGEKAGAKVYDEGQGDPVTIAKNGLRCARDYGHDIVILDTAGRLHIDEVLMREIEEIKKVSSPHEVLLVVDAMTGQDAVNVAEAFAARLDITGVILTKLDGDTRGGAALSVRAATGKPIKFAGIGEKISDLEVFHPDRMTSRILGMGDVLSLIEKAEREVDAEEAEKLAEKMMKNTFTLDDMLGQLQSLKKMGPLSQVMGMMPGAPKVSDADERQLVRVQAVIQSMTGRERERPKIITPQRKRRIAAGSGTRVEDVNRVLKQFEAMQKFMKMMGKNGGKGLGRGFPGMKMPGGML